MYLIDEELIKLVKKCISYQFNADRLTLLIDSISTFFAKFKGSGAVSLFSSADQLSADVVKQSVNM